MGWQAMAFHCRQRPRGPHASTFERGDVSMLRFIKRGQSFRPTTKGNRRFPTCYVLRIEQLEDRTAPCFGNATQYAAGSGPYSIAVSDFNNDLKQDLAVVERFSNTIGILLGNGDG